MQNISLHCFWDCTWSLLTQIISCHNLLWSCRGHCEGVQIRQSLKDLSKTTFIFLLKRKREGSQGSFWNKLTGHCITADEQKGF